MHSYISFSIRFFVMAVLLWLFTGCKPQPVKAKIVAQVGSAALTLEQLRGNFPKEYEHLVSKDQYLDYVKRWIDQEILYQEALSIKLNENPAIIRLISEQTKKIIVEEYLARHSMGITYTPDEPAIQQYYDVHQAEFLRQEPEIKFATISLKSLKKAWEVRELVNANNFISILNQVSLGLKPVSLQDLSFKKFDEIDACIASEAFSIRIGGISRPLKCNDVYNILRVVDKKAAGSLKDIDDVREEIANILVNVWSKKQLDQKIKELKDGMFYSYDISLVPGLDTLKVEPEPLPEEPPEQAPGE